MERLNICSYGHIETYAQMCMGIFTYLPRDIYLLDAIKIPPSTEALLCPGEMLPATANCSCTQWTCLFGTGQDLYFQESVLHLATEYPGKRVRCNISSAGNETLAKKFPSADLMANVRFTNVDLLELKTRVSKCTCWSQRLQGQPITLSFCASFIKGARVKKWQRGKSKVQVLFK